MTGCIEWTKSRDRHGYGRSKQLGAHREAYRKAYGDIPAGLHVLHHCDNPPCINPEHLFLGTHLDNMRDAIAKGRGGVALFATRTACIHGHPYDEANTYYRTNGRRDCRACNRDRTRAYLNRLKVRAAA